LRDDEPEINEAAISYFINMKNASEHVPAFHQMLKSTNSNVQMAGIRVLLRLGVTPSREELLPLFSVPRMEVAGPAVAVLREKGISCEEAKPLLQNSNFGVRLMGLSVLVRNQTRDSVDLMIPLLRD